MERESKRRHESRRIGLPSGKVVEFSKARSESDLPSTRRNATADHATARHGRGKQPHLCPACGSDLVYPVAWRDVAHGRWEAYLRCPNCERREMAVIGHATAERFDEEMERGADHVKSELVRLTEANMAESLTRFVAALEADAIQPVDF